MSEGTRPVQWSGPQAVVTLPGHIDRSNADLIREQLLRVLNRGAAVLIADMSATVSCDFSGADAVRRAHQRAVASGAQVRVVVTAEVVSQVLSHSGVDRLVSVYPTRAAAIAAGAEPRTGLAGAGIVVTSLPESGPHDGAQTPPEDSVARAEELLDWVVNSIFTVGVSLQTALGLPRDVSAEKITQALQQLDEVVREVRHQVFADRGHGIPPGLAAKLPADLRARLELARDRNASLRQRVVQAAYTLHFAASDTAVLIEQRADFVSPPGRIDYPTEIKRWRAIADQSRQIAERWEQQRPDSGQN